MTADKEPEMVCVPCWWTSEMIDAFKGECAGDADEPSETRVIQAWQAALAARPATEHVAVPRSKLERWANMLQAASDAIETVGVVSNRIENVHAEIRALLAANGGKK